MAYVRVRDGSSAGVDLYYEDHGSGPSLVLVHGWPLASEVWEKQVPVLVQSGYRVVSYDRRGFGRSSRPASGYDYETLAADLDVLMTTLDLRGAGLVGFSMGTGECVRYLARYGSARVRAVALLSSIAPFLSRTPDNPGGVDRAVFDAMTAAIARDRYAFASAFLRDYYNVGVLGRDRVSDDVVRASWNLTAQLPARILTECVSCWLADFRPDLPALDVPALVLHGDDDAIFPIAATGLRLHQGLAGSRWVAVEGGAHGLLWTHAEEVNQALLAFLELHLPNAVR